MAKSKQVAKTLVNFRLSEEALDIIDKWAALHGASRTGGLESLIRRFDRLENIVRNPADRLGELRKAYPLKGEMPTSEPDDSQSERTFGATGGRTAAQPDDVVIIPAKDLQPGFAVRVKYDKDGLTVMPPNSLSGEAKEERAKGKAEKRERKAELQKAATGAIGSVKPPSVRVHGRIASEPVYIPPVAELQEKVKEALPLARTGAQPILKPGKK